MINIAAARRTQRPTAELNVAPLIDMVFILLIFFLVTTSFVKETGIDINKPAAATAVSQTAATIMIGIDAADRIYIDRREVDVRAVQANVMRALAEHPDGTVVVAADKASSTGTAIQVMDGCRLAGATRISLAASLPQAR